MPPKGDFFLVCPTWMTFPDCSTIICWPCGEHQLERCLIVKSWPNCVKKTNVGLSFSRQRPWTLLTESLLHQMQYVSFR
jgi:hypothetical protein